MSAIEDKVCNLIQERATVGLAKYGTSMERTDLSEKEWLQHAQEEALDFVIYLEKLKQEACVLSEDDMFQVLALLQTILYTQSLDYDMQCIYACIAKKLQDALNLV